MIRDPTSIARILAVFIISFLLSHLLSTHVFFTDALVVKPQFKERLRDSQIRLTLFIYDWRYKIGELPGIFTRIPYDRQLEQLPPPWYFVPPPEWLASQPPSNTYPVVPRPTRPPLIRIPTLKPIGQPPPTQPPPAPPTITPIPTMPLPSPTRTPGLAPSQAAAELLNLINNERGKNNVAILLFDNRLNQAAQNYANSIGSARVCSHTYGSTLVERYREVGYPAVGGGENITCGISEVNSAFNAWINSGGHKANMLDKAWKSAGLGFFAGYWVLNLGPI